jgi:hypothetical protein
MEFEIFSELEKFRLAVVKENKANNLRKCHDDGRDDSLAEQQQLFTCC